MLTTPTAAPVLRAGRAGARRAGAGGAARRCASCSPPAERPFVIVGGSGWTRRACEALERFAERWQLPVGCAFRFQDVFDNRHPNYAGDVGIGINPKLAARIDDADLIVAIGPRLGEMTTGGYELLAAAAAAPAAGPPPRRRRGARPRLRRRPADQRVDGLRRAGARRARRRRRRCAGATGPRRRTPTTKPTSCRRRSRRSTWPRSCETIDRLVPADTDLHQRRRQLQRLAAPLPPLRRPAPRRPHAARADLGRDGLRRCRRRSPRRCSSRSAPSINLAGDGDFLMNGQELATATAHGAGRGAGKLISDRRRQRHLRHDPHAPGARVPGPARVDSRASATCRVNPRLQPARCAAARVHWLG